MTELLLVRHGETDWNAEQRFQGHADPPLNERGRGQARELARQLRGAHLEALYTSPLRRAAETAAILSVCLGLPARPLGALREIDVGEWQGLTRTEVEERFPEAFARWLAFGPGWEAGETYEQLGARVLAGFREIAAAHPRGRVLVVTHGGPLRSALAVCAGVPYGVSRRHIDAVANCGIVRLGVADGTVRVLE
ncbi:MAG: histidine phosphatase family protein [Thermoleophilia bacterium]|nr:histidine phosphatase family protein [Thermoleophilia bacterium]